MKHLIAGVCLFSSLFGAAQDIHFSQISEIPLLLNPAATGVYNGWERVSMNHRNQWLGGNTTFHTTSLAADINLFKSDREYKGYLGVGVFFYKDAGGDSDFGNQTGSLSLSGVLPILDGGHTLSAGIQGGFASRSGNLNNVFFENQWNGSAFDPTIPQAETATLDNYQYLDFSTGVMYQFDGSESSFSRNNSTKFQVGAAVYHVNKPAMNFSGVQGMQLYRKLVVHTLYAQEIDRTDWAFEVSGVQFVQGPHYQTILGGKMKRRFMNGSKITGFKQDAYVGFGAYWRLKDAFIPTVSLDWKGFKFGMSYDVTISQMRRAYSGGSLEFSLSYTNLKHALFKGRRK